jgi:NAD(P)-dependent dehydrogenase (short-subunit alcohol dehydrogenase family)
VDILVNNLSCNANVESLGQYSRLENYPYSQWARDLELGLGGAFLCSKFVGSYMASKSNSGVIVNIASDLSVIAPDQRLYRKEGLADDEQPVKPISYSVVKHGIMGLTKYLATYWAGKVRVNALSPGGVYNNQPDDFVKYVSNLIPMGRMARVNELQGALVFLCSEASSYITGINLVADGGRTII